MEKIKLKKREEYTLWRRRNRVRLIDVAEYCGVSISLISLWENGKQGISPETLKNYDEYIAEFEKGRVYATNEQ
jgi:transcriptional regulator with XRE-family HTH domain